jgi:hypothetical protein
MPASIVSITDLQNLPNLTTFYGDSNSLQSVNLSSLTNLSSVSIGNNDIPGSSTNSLTSVNLSGCTALVNLVLNDSDFSGGIPNLTGLINLDRIYFDNCSISGAVDLSNLSALTQLSFDGNTALTSIVISDTQLITYFYATNCALTETAVNNILQSLDSSGVINGNVNLLFGTSAAPTGAGLTARTNLIAKGWNVYTNTYSFSVRRNNTGPCASSPVTTIYSDSPVLEEGANVYDDPYLTSPTQVAVHICDCVNSFQYMVDSSHKLGIASPVTCI